LHENNASELGRASKIGSKTGEDDRSRGHLEQDAAYATSKRKSRHDSDDYMNTGSKRGQTKRRAQAAAFGRRDDL